MTIYDLSVLLRRLKLRRIAGGTRLEKAGYVENYLYPPPDVAQPGIMILAGAIKHL